MLVLTSLRSAFVWVRLSVILKPSEKVPGAATVLARLITEAGIPAGVFQVIVQVHVHVRAYHVLCSAGVFVVFGVVQL